MNCRNVFYAIAKQINANCWEKPKLNLYFGSGIKEKYCDLIPRFTYHVILIDQDISHKDKVK